MIKNIHEKLDRSYFASVDTNEKAYWLGFLFADGSVNSIGTTLRLLLSKKDEFQLDNFIRCVNANPALKHYSEHGNSSAVSITIINKQLVGNLISLGCTSKKTMLIRLPALESEDLGYAFLMGFFDGDGSRNGSLSCGNLQFLKDIIQKYDLPNEPLLQMNHWGQCYKLYLPAKLRRKMYASYSGMARKRHVELGKKTRPWQRKAIRPEKDILEEMINKRPMTHIGKMFGVSNTAIKKWAVEYGIELKNKRGYWTKVKCSTI